MDNPMALNGPVYGLDCSTSSAAVTLNDADINTSRVIVSNTTTSAVFVTSGTTSPTAAFPATNTKVAGKVIPAGSTQVFTKDITHKYIAAILSSGSGAVYFAIGSGT